MPAHVIALLVGLAFGAAPARALETRTLEVSVVGGIYRVNLDAVLDAPLERVERVLTNYVGYAALDPRIRSSELVGRAPDGAALVRTRIRACAAFFCREVERLERVTLEPRAIVARVLPQQSEVRTGKTRIEWRTEGDRTAIRYATEFVPDFWVPAIIARNHAASTLRESVLLVFQNVEEQARVR